MDATDKIREIIYKIMSADMPLDESQDRIWDGLQILVKYTHPVIVAAGHDTIYSADIDVLVEAGITIDDCEKLRRLNWFIKDECFAHFT
jgi:uncharacterized protein related to proFAR isomerase